jgi:hypothetical protein
VEENRRRAEEAKREEREIARAVKHRLVDEKRRERTRRWKGDEEAEREQLAPEILSRISQYSMASVDPDARREAEERSGQPTTGERQESTQTE